MVLGDIPLKICVVQTQEDRCEIRKASWGSAELYMLIDYEVWRWVHDPCFISYILIPQWVLEWSEMWQ